MACTTILVGKKASYDGSTMIARNDDSGSGSFTPKKFVVIHPSEQPTHYKSEISHVEIELPDHPMRYTAMPNAVKGEGIWAASGVNAARVGMTATETITSNPRVLGHQYDEQLAREKDETKRMQLREKANERVAEMLKKETAATLNQVLYELSNLMKNSYSRSDA